MIKIYPNLNTKVNFGDASISPKAAQEYIEAFEKADQYVNTIGNDPYYKALADDLSKTTRDGKPKRKATDEEIAILKDKVKKLVGEKGDGGLKKELTDAGKNFKNEGNVPVDNVPKWVQNMFKKASNSKLIKYLASKGPKGIALALAAGNVGKEVVGTMVYTVQAWTNEDLPADKRKFIGMYDLIVGLISTTFSAVFGFGAIAVQDKLIKNALAKNKGTGFPKYAAAYAGLVWLIPNILQTIIGKRIVAPAIATPVAGNIKNKMMAKAEAKKALANQANNTTLAANQAPQAAKTVELKPTETVQDTKATEPQQTVSVQFVSLSSYVADAQEAKNAA